MKKFLLLAIIAVFLNSCISYSYYAVNSYTIDYYKYTEKGFFITESNSVNFNYEPVGSVVVESISGYYNSEYVAANIDDAFIKLYQISQKNNANGVINVKINFVNSYQDVSTKEFHPNRWVVTGMLIKK